MEKSRNLSLCQCSPIFEVCKIILFYTQNYTRYVTEMTKMANRKKVTLIDFERPYQEEMHLNKQTPENSIFCKFKSAKL